jgi:hypothetical protein
MLYSTQLIEGKCTHSSTDSQKSLSHLGKQSSATQTLITFLLKYMRLFILCTAQIKLTPDYKMTSQESRSFHTIRQRRWAVV